MKIFINYTLRALCLLLYFAAAAGPATALTEPLVYWLRVVAIVMLLAHILELLVFYPRMRRQQGALALAMLSAILFGMLHWKAPVQVAARTAPR